MNKARISMTLTSCCECPHSDTVDWKVCCLKKEKIVPLVRIESKDSKIYYDNKVPNWCPHLIKEKCNHDWVVDYVEEITQCSKCGKKK